MGIILVSLFDWLTSKTLIEEHSHAMLYLLKQCAHVRLQVIFKNRSAVRTRDHEVREHIPVPYDNLFQSILKSKLFLVSVL